MAEMNRCAVTAIRDMHQEGFIAAALTRLEWKVLYRATSPDGLHKFLSQNPQVLVVQSDDFAPSKEVMNNQHILIRGRSLPQADTATVDPSTDFELEELLHKYQREINEEPFFIAATTTTILSISSVGRYVGATTFSVNMADLLTQQGKKVLLVDGNFANPSLAHHFSTHNIFSAPQQTSFGFSLFEVKDLPGMLHLGAISEEYEAIVIDAGQLQTTYSSGRRLKDQLDSWISHSHARKVFCTRTDTRSLNELQRVAPQNTHWSIALMPSKVISRRDRNLLEFQVTEKFGVPVQSISRDGRAIEKMEGQSTTLANVAPKSILMGEIARSLEVAMG